MPRHTALWKVILLVKTAYTAYVLAVSEPPAHECIPGKYHNPVVWVQPGEPVEIKSPTKLTVTATETLSCDWEIRALWGTKLEMRVDRKNVNYKCNDNELEVQSITNPLINYKAACNKDSFPSLLKTTVDLGPMLVKFKSNSNDGSVNFTITFTSVDPPKIEKGWVSKSSCPHGPCCSGKDCCVYNIDDSENLPLLGQNNTSLINGLYDMTSSDTSVPKKNCIAKLKAPPGFQVSVNFQHLDMLESVDGSCSGDFVKLYEPEDKKPTTFSLIGKTGLTFCGQHLPNSPGPSIFSSSRNELYVQYKTDETERKRGDGYGFKLIATAINPVVTTAKFSHQYGDKTCQDTCKPVIPEPQTTTTTTTPPPEICVERNNKIFIIEANKPHDYISNAKIEFRTENNNEITKFIKYSNNDGLIDFSTDKENKIKSGQAYSLTIKTNDYVEKTIDVHLHCKKKGKSLCESCYFYKKVAPPTTTTALPPKTRPTKKVTGATSEQPTAASSEKTTEATSAKPGGTTISKKVGKTTTVPKIAGTTSEAIPATTTQKIIGTTSVAIPASTVSKILGTTIRGTTTPGTTLPPGEETFISCKDTDKINSLNQLLCDCTETKCDPEILKDTGECEPCIEIPVVEPPTPTTISTTPCVGDDCTTQPPTTPCVGDQCTTQPTTTPCKEDRRITIKVIDANSTDPVKDAKVELSHEQIAHVASKTTDSIGQVNIEVSLDGKFSVRITKEGYEEGEGDAALNCTSVGHVCNCTITVEIRIIKRQPCEKLYLVLKAEREVDARGSGLWSPIQYFLLWQRGPNKGKPGTRTQVRLVKKKGEEIKGTFRGRYPGEVVYDVTGMIPNTFTFTVDDVQGPNGGYEKNVSSFEYEQKCSANSKMIPWRGKQINECCKKEHNVRVSKEENEETPKPEPPETTTSPCKLGREDKLHIRVCGDASYSAYGDPSISIHATCAIKNIYRPIIDNEKLSTIKSGSTSADQNLKCPSNTILIKEFDPELPSNFDMDHSTFDLKVNGKGFKETRESQKIHCSDACKCSDTIQVLVEPKTCDKEYFTIVVKDAGTDSIVPGATVTAWLKSGLKIAEEVTNEQGLVNIKIDRSINQLRLDITKTGYVTNDKENPAINCKFKECGECQPKLTTTITEATCTTPMNVTITVETDDGNPVPNTPIKLVLIRGTGTGTPRQVKENTWTDNFGKRTLVIHKNGTYEVEVQSDGNIDQVKEFVIKNCEHKDINFTLTPAPTKSTATPCNDGDPGCTTPKTTEPPCTETEITFNVRDISKNKETGDPLENATIIVEYIKKIGQQSIPSKVTLDSATTDSEGVLKVLATTNGNYSYSLSKKGYLKDPTVGFIFVDCERDPVKGCDCKPTVNITVKEPFCNRTTYPQNLFIEVTDETDHKSISGAEVILTLLSHGGIVKTEEIGRKRTHDNGIVSYLRPVNGEYNLEIKQENYIKYQKPMTYACNPEVCQTCNKSIVVALEKEFCTNITLKVSIVDAINNTKPIIGAELSMTMDGEGSGVIKHMDREKVPSNGIMHIKLDKNGNYKFTVEAPGYITYTDTHNVNITLEECEAYIPIKTVPISTPPKENCTRASLTWTKKPLDLDLYTFRVLNSDSSKHCQTYFCDEKELCGCTTFDTENLYQGDEGAETITLCCADLYSYMIYVDNRQIQTISLDESGARITLLSNIKTQKIDMVLPVRGTGADERYWIAGCLVAGDGDFTYIPVNQFTVNQPSSAEPLLCHNLVNTLREKEKRDSFPKDAQLQVSAIDIATHEEISGVSITLAAMRNNKIVQQEKTTSNGTYRADSKLSFTLGENGRYKVTAEKEGYTSTPVYSTINCYKTPCLIQPITMYMLKKITPGDLRISLTYQEDRPYYLSLFQVNKQNSQESCDAIKGYDTQTNKVSCKGMELEWSSYPQIIKFGKGNGDSILLRDASSHAKYTYLIYVAKINVPDKFTYLTISDSKSDKVFKVKAPNSEGTQEIFWIAGCLSIEGTSFNFVEKNVWLQKDPTVDGKLMCHSMFTDETQAVRWEVPPAFCPGSSLSVIAKDIDGKIIDNVNSTTTNVLDYSITYDQFGPKPDLVLRHTINQLKDTKLTGNGVYTTKVEAEGYVTDRVERRVSCDMDQCDKCSTTTNIVLAKQSEIDTGDAILTVTSQNGAKLLFIVHNSDNANVEKNAKGDRITIPYGTSITKITVAVTQDITETGKLNNADAVFTLRYGDSLLRLKLPLDAYHDEKYWLIGSAKIKDNKEIEFFSDNFYANVLDVFGSVPRSIGMTLPAPAPPAYSRFKLDFGDPEKNVQEDFHKLGLPDGGNRGTYTGTFQFEGKTAIIKISGYSNTRGNYKPVTNKFAHLSNLLRSSFLRNSPGTMIVEISSLTPSTKYIMKTYHHSTSFPRGGGEFKLEYAGKIPNTLKQSANGQNPDPPLIHTEIDISNNEGKISLIMKKESGNSHMDLNGLEISRAIECKADEKISGAACICQNTICDIGATCTGGKTCTPGNEA